mmetsp:Transcript_144227/g.461872  ORF Transcript_144227/g.461872 Transcript_144227/m.461872 type:complete len:227 (+) Transcript_144227:64-744(+)
MVQPSDLNCNGFPVQCYSHSSRMRATGALPEIQPPRGHGRGRRPLATEAWAGRDVILQTRSSSSEHRPGRRPRRDRGWTGRAISRNPKASPSRSPAAARPPAARAPPAGARRPRGLPPRRESQGGRFPGDRAGSWRGTHGSPAPEMSAPPARAPPPPPPPPTRPPSAAAHPPRAARRLAAQAPRVAAKIPSAPGTTAPREPSADPPSRILLVKDARALDSHARASV